MSTNPYSHFVLAPGPWTTSQTQILSPRAIFGTRLQANYGTEIVTYDKFDALTLKYDRIRRDPLRELARRVEDIGLDLRAFLKELKEARRWAPNLIPVQAAVDRRPRDPILARPWLRARSAASRQHRPVRSRPGAKRCRSSVCKT